MERNCQVNDLVYKCDVTKPSPEKVYLGLAEGEWKNRVFNHKLSFKHKRYSNKTTLASYMWHLKSASSDKPNLKWSVLRCITPCMYVYMYVCTSLFRVNQVNSTTIMTNKNQLTPRTDQKWKHDLALYLSLLQSYMYRARFILNSGEHEVLRFIQLNI